MKKQTKLLTEVELEMMNILWKKGEGTVGDVLEGLSAQRNLAYTSVSTILRILEKKGILSSRKEGRGHLYIPKLSKENYETRSVEHLVENVFEGAPLQLIRCLIETKQITKSELAEVRALIKNI